MWSTTKKPFFIKNLISNLEIIVLGKILIFIVKAHVKAAAKLSETEKCIAGGQAYNISDNCPMEPYQFIKPLFDAMEQPLPWIPLPFFFVYILAYILEILHYAVGVYPIFTRNEIVKVTNSHYCKMDKAINELGYSPKTYKVGFLKWVLK